MAIAVAKIVILAGWAVFLGWLPLFGRADLARLLHPDLWWLLLAAVVVLALLAAVQCRSLSRLRHQPSSWWQWPSLAILLLPPLFFLQAREARFDGETFAKRSLASLEAYRPPQSTEEAPAADLSGEVPLSTLYGNIDAYLGKEVEVVCQTLDNRQLPENVVMCYRYLMNCCAADAMPLFIFISYGEGEAVQGERWVQARGTLSLHRGGGLTVPQLTLGRMSYVEEPAFPFLLR